MVSLVGINALPKFTPSTIVDLFELKNEIGNIIRQGYALEIQEHEQGVVAIAVPVRDMKSEVIGAINVSVPACRLDGRRVEHELGLIGNSCGR
jgi:DNA-binding IclR family transcriptional regulator